MVSIGSTKAADGVRTPTYAPDLNLLAQVQPLTYRDLQQLEGLNLAGIKWKIYLNGEIDSVVRSESKGGDIVIIPTGRHKGTWLVVQVLEQFPDWASAAITFQSTTIPPVPGGLTTDLTDTDNDVIVPLILTGV